MTRAELLLHLENVLYRSIPPPWTLKMRAQRAGLTHWLYNGQHEWPSLEEAELDLLREIINRLK